MQRTRGTERALLAAAEVPGQCSEPVSFLGSVEAAELSSPSRITPAMADESWKAHTHCWLCNRRAYKEADKRRLPAAASEPHDLTVLTPDSEWVHESCSSLIRKSRRVRTSAPAAQAPLISQCWAPSSAPASAPASSCLVSPLQLWRGRSAGAPLARGLLGSARLATRRGCVTRRARLPPSRPWDSGGVRQLGYRFLVEEYGGHASRATHRG